MIRAALFRTPVLVWLLGAAAAFGGPVGQDQASTPPSVLPQIQDLSAADPAASSAAAAAKILEEAQADSTSDEAPAARHKPAARSASAPAASSPSPRPASGAAARAPGKAASAAGESPLHHVAKAAIEWIKDVVPGLRDDDEADQPAPPPETVNWDTSGLEGGGQGRGGLAGSNLGGAGFGAGAQPGAGMPSLEAAPSNEVQRLLRDAMEVLGMVIGHPMAWLVVALFAIGGYAMSKIDRRPK